MGADVSGSTSTKSDPNVVPLCDILLVLLIIFMVLTPVAQRGIDIQLPEKSTNVGPERSGIVLTLEKDLSLKINQELVNRDMLDSRLKDIFMRRTDKTIFIRADKSVSYREVLRIIDVAKGSGIEVLGVVTQTYESNPE